MSIKDVTMEEEYPEYNIEWARFKPSRERNISEEWERRINKEILKTKQCRRSTRSTIGIKSLHFQKLFWYICQICISEEGEYKKVVNNITLVDVLGELEILSNTLQNNKFDYYNWLSV